MISRRRVDPFVLTTILFLAAYAARFVDFLAGFPTSYTWSELMIAYQGGYVRRGLLGQVAFLLDGTLGARPILAGVVGLGYLAVVVVFARAARAASPWTGMLFLLSPATLLFPLLDPEAYGRKDVVILLAFALSLGVARCFGRTTTLVLIAAIYAGANFVIDAVVFYAPMAVFAGLHLGKEPRRGGAILKGSLIATLLLGGLCALNLALNAKFTGDNAARYQELIARAWRARYPDAFQPSSAVEYIGMSVGDGIELVVQNVSVYPTLPCYLLCLVLAFVPVLVLARQVRWDRVDGWERACCAQAVACGCLPFVFAADWGRYIHLLAMQAFLVLLSLPLRVRSGTAPAGWPLRAAAIAAILAYATGWRMLHFVDGGSSALAPGIAFAPP